MVGINRGSRSAQPEGEKKPFVRPSMTEVRRLLSYLQPYRGRMAISIVALVFSAALNLVFPWVIQNVVDSVLVRHDYGELNRITLLLIATFLVRSIFTYIQVYSLTYTGERIVTDLRKQVYNHLHRLSLRFFTTRRTGELISRLSSVVT